MKKIEENFDDFFEKIEKIFEQSFLNRISITFLTD
jgi:hypothetical protein